MSIIKIDRFTHPFPTFALCLVTVSIILLLSTLISSISAVKLIVTIATTLGPASSLYYPASLQEGVDEINRQSILFPNITLKIVLPPTASTGYGSAAAIIKGLATSPANPAMILFGDNGVAASEAAGMMASYLNKPHLICAAASPAISDKTWLPMTVRNSVSDSGAADAALTVFQAYNWTKVAFICSYDDLGWNFAAYIVPRLPPYMKVTFFWSRTLNPPINSVNINNMLTTIRTSGYNIIWLHGTVGFLTNVLISAYNNNMLNPPYQWIGDSTCDITQTLTPTIAAGSIGAFKGFLCFSLGYSPAPRLNQNFINWRYRTNAVYSQVPLQLFKSIDVQQKCVGCYEAAYIIAQAAQNMFDDFAANNSIASIDLNGSQFLPYLYNVNLTAPMSNQQLTFTPGGEVSTIIDVFNFGVQSDGSAARFDWKGTFVTGKPISLISPIVWSTGLTTAPLDYVPVYQANASIETSITAIGVVIGIVCFLVGSVATLLSIQTSIRSKATCKSVKSERRNGSCGLTQSVEWAIVAAFCFTAASIWACHAAILFQTNLPSQFTPTYNLTYLILSIIIPYALVLTAFLLGLQQIKYRSLKVADIILSTTQDREFGEKLGGRGSVRHKGDLNQDLLSEEDYNEKESSAFISSHYWYRSFFLYMVKRVISVFNIRTILAAILIEAAISISFHFLMMSLQLPASTTTSSIGFFVLLPLVLLPITIFCLSDLFHFVPGHSAIRQWCVILTLGLITLFSHSIDSSLYSYTFSQDSYSDGTWTSSNSVTLTTLTVIIASFEGVALLLIMGLLIQMNALSRNVMDLVLVDAQTYLLEKKKLLQTLTDSNELGKTKEAEWSKIIWLLQHSRPVYREHAVGFLLTSAPAIENKRVMDFEPSTTAGAQSSHPLHTPMMAINDQLLLDGDDMTMAEKEGIELVKSLTLAFKSSRSSIDSTFSLPLSLVISHPVTLEMFKDELIRINGSGGSNASLVALFCYLDIIRWDELKDTSVKLTVAQQIFSTFLSNNSNNLATNQTINASSLVYPLTISSPLRLSVISLLKVEPSSRSLSLVAKTFASVKEECLTMLSNEWNTMIENEMHNDSDNDKQKSKAVAFIRLVLQRMEGKQGFTIGKGNMNESERDRVMKLDSNQEKPPLNKGTDYSSSPLRYSRKFSSSIGQIPPSPNAFSIRKQDQVQIDKTEDEADNRNIDTIKDNEEVVENEGIEKEILGSEIPLLKELEVYPTDLIATVPTSSLPLSTPSASGEEKTWLPGAIEGEGENLVESLAGGERLSY